MGLLFVAVSMAPESRWTRVMEEEAMGIGPQYAARLRIDYPERLDRLSMTFRLIWIIPVAIVESLLSAIGNETVITATGENIIRTTGGVFTGLWLATLLMIVFRRRYPRRWFDYPR